MDLDWFKDLAALARTGNFSQAAESNHISQSAFSRRIQSLEGWVGTSLVDRSTHPVRLTEAGRQILEAGTQALDRIETERIQIQEMLQRPDSYVVTFATQHSIGWRFFPTWLQRFEQAFGPIISRLRADNLPNCITDLHAGEVDFVICYESDRAPALSASPASASLVIGRDQLIPVSKTGPRGAALFRIDDDQVTSIPYLRFGPAAPIGEHIEPLLASHALGARLTPAYENSMAGALRIRARDGLGIAWLPRTLVTPDLESGQLTLAGGEQWWIDVEIHLHRLKSCRNTLILNIWDFLARRQGRPLA